MRSRTLALTALVSLLAAGGARAHAVFTNPSADAGAHWAGAIRIGHACSGGDVTTQVRIEIPAGLNVVRAQPKAGWILSLEREPLAQPETDHGKVLTERVRAVVWTGRLTDEQFDDFAIAARLPDQPGALVFPVIQTCAGGVSRWIETPGPDGSRPKYPAPVLRVGDYVEHRSH